MLNQFLKNLNLPHLDFTLKIIFRQRLSAVLFGFSLHFGDTFFYAGLNVAFENNGVFHFRHDFGAVVCEERTLSWQISCAHTVHSRL